MPRIDDTVVELLLAERAIRSLGALRPALTQNERLRVAEGLRAIADQVDHGDGQRNPPTPPARDSDHHLPNSEQEPAPQPEHPPDPKPATDDAVRVPAPAAVETRRQVELVLAKAWNCGVQRNRRFLLRRRG